MGKDGFTLTEVIVAVGLLSIIALLGFMAMTSSASSVNVAKARHDVQASLSNVMMEITAELQLAAKTPDPSLSPPLEAPAIVLDPGPVSPVELVFQIPADGSGRNWSAPVRLRYVNEDVNGNLRLDPGEDLDGDGVLSRRLVRIQDANGDGDTADPGEMRTLGAANNIANCQFAIDGNVVTVTLSASSLISGRAENPVQATLIRRIYLLN